MTAESDFRLSHVVAVKYWLPMRSGSPVTLQSRHGKELIRNNVLLRMPVSIRECHKALEELQLDFFEEFQPEENHEV